MKQTAEDDIDITQFNFTLKDSTINGHSHLQPSFRLLALNLLPLILTGYCFSLADRSALGNIRSAIIKNLSLNDSEYSFSVSAFYITYITCGIPANWLMINWFRVSLQRFLGLLLVCWGLVSMSTAAVHDYGQLVLVRLLLGLFEAGFTPALLLYLCRWFDDQQRSKAWALTLICNPFSGILGGILSYFSLTQFDSALLAGWRVMFIILGSSTVIVGCLTYLRLPGQVSEALFLSENQRINLQSSQIDPYVSRTQLKTSSLCQIVHHSLLWYYIILTSLSLTPVITLGFFLPIFLQSFGVDPNQANLLTIVPYLFSVIVSIWSGWRSDRYVAHRRKEWSILTLLSALGFLLTFLFSFTSFTVIRATFLFSACASTYGLFVYFSSMSNQHIVEYFTAQQSAHLIPICFACFTTTGNLTGFFVPMVLNYIKSMFGAYDFMFLVLTLMNIIAFILLQIPLKTSWFEGHFLTISESQNWPLNDGPQSSGQTLLLADQLQSHQRDEIEL
jgi:MFS family permease